MSPRSRIMALAAVTLLLSACGDDQVSVYKVPKEKEPDLPAAAADQGGPAAPAPGASMADTAVPTASGDGLSWQAPEGWAQKAAGAMRKASYSVPGSDGDSDLSVTAFPGDVGGPLANVNRWLGQVGLPPIDEPGLPQYTSHMEANGLVFFLADTGAKDPTHEQRIVAAVVFWQGNSWFFKLMGPTDLVAKEKPEFTEFLGTVHTP